MAGNKYYIGQSLDIEIDIIIDGVKMASAGDAVIEVQKPNRTKIEWTPTIDNVAGKLTYSAAQNEIDQAGTWLLQPIITLAGNPSKVIPGSTVSLTVSKRFT